MGSEPSRVLVGAWWTAAAAVGLVGWVAALLTTPPSALIASAVVFAAFSLLFGAGVQTTRENRRPAGAEAPGAGPAGASEGGAAPGDWRRIVDSTVLGTVGAIAALGLLQVSVGVAFVVGLVLAATAGYVFVWRTPVREPAAGGTHGSPPHRVAEVPLDDAVTDVLGPASPAGPGPSAGAGATSGPGAAAEVRGLTTTELVLAWRRSYSQLMRVRSPHQLAALAARRQQLLDELERRDAAGVERWLRSGARAASDPSRFLQRPTGPSATSA